MCGRSNTLSAASIAYIQKAQEQLAARKASVDEHAAEAAKELEGETDQSVIDGVNSGVAADRAEYEYTLAATNAIIAEVSAGTSTGSRIVAASGVFEAAHADFQQRQQAEFFKALGSFAAAPTIGVGDTVFVTGNRDYDLPDTPGVGISHDFTIGDEVKIVDVDDDGDFRVERVSDGYLQFISPPQVSRSAPVTLQ